MALQVKCLSSKHADARVGWVRLPTCNHSAVQSQAGIQQLRGWLEELASSGTLRDPASVNKVDDG